MLDLLYIHSSATRANPSYMIMPAGVFGLLNELRRAGPIDIVGRRIHLLDTDALGHWADSEEPWAN